MLKSAGVAEDEHDIITVSPSMLNYGTVSRMNKNGAADFVDNASGPRVTRRRTPTTHSTVPPPAAPTTAAPAATAPPPYQIPPIPPSATGYGSEEWLSILALQQHETDEKLKTILELVTSLQEQVQSLASKSEKCWIYLRDHCRVQNRLLRRLDPLLGGEIPRFPSGIVPPQVRLPTVAVHPVPAVTTAAPSVTVPPEAVATAPSTSMPDTDMHAAATSSNPVEGGKMN